jgi:hypothetical protein
MQKLRRLSVILLLVSSLFMTGCDATQILDVISKVAQGVQQAMPAIQNVVNTFSNIFGNNNNNNNNNNNTAVNNTNTQQAADANTNAQANVVTIDPNAEDVTGNNNTGQNNNNGQQAASVDEIINGAQIAVPYSQVGTESTLAEAAAIKNKYGITVLDGKTWQDQWNSATAAKWTSQQAAQFAAIMEKLPSAFRSCTRGFTMQSIIRDNDGNEPSGLGGDPIMISNKAIGAGGWISMEELVVHEMTHQFQAKNPDVLRQWAARFWPNNRPVRSSITDYGNTDSGEDMAECVAAYFKDPERMRQHDPERYEFIRQNVLK